MFFLVQYWKRMCNAFLTGDVQNQKPLRLLETNIHTKYYILEIVVLMEITIWKNHSLEYI